MACKNVCRLCPKLVISSAVTFTGGNLIINLPAGNYGNGCKYCIIVAQSRPATTTINAPVFVTIGTGTQLYPLTKRDCSQAVACEISSRTKYSTCVVTTPTSASFRLMGNIGCCRVGNNLVSVNGTAPTTTPGTASGDETTD